MDQETPAVLKDDPLSGWLLRSGAVLLSDEIEYYSTQTDHPLIEHLDPDQLKPAGYRLRLGSQAHLGGKPVVVEDGSPLDIEPHQVAVVTTYEKLRIPRFLLARWNLRVSMVYKGLLWVGALQVDPGWVGELIAPIYNLGRDTVRLHFREPLFTIDFVRTTKYLNTSRRFIAKSRTLEEYDSGPLKSAHYDVLDRLKQVESSVRDEADALRANIEIRASALDDRLDTTTRMGLTLVVITVAVLGAIITALSVLTIGPLVDAEGELLNNWALAALAMSGFAAFLSLVVAVPYLVDRFWPKRSAETQNKK